MDTLSIITTSYEQGEYLERCIRSVADQSIETEVEHLIVDGGSGDSTLEVIKRYSDHIDWWCSEPDEGPPAALNKGVRRATGSIVGCLNADDYYCHGALGTILRAFQDEQSADVVYGHGVLVDHAARTICRIYSDRWDLERALYGRCPIVQQGTFYRREAFDRAGGFNESNMTCWDFELLVDMACAGAEFRRVNATLGAFRLHGASITGSGLGEEHERDHERIRKRVEVGDPLMGVELKRRWIGLKRFSQEPRLAARRAWARVQRSWHQFRYGA